MPEDVCVPGILLFCAGVVVSLAASLFLGGKTALAGRWPNPGVDVARAQAYASVWYTETFRAGELAVVSIRGDGDKQQ